MSDLISKKALMEALRSIQKYAPISLECAKNSLGDYFYDADIIDLLNSAPAVSVEDAFRLGILYASQKYEVVRNETFTGGDVADFLFMEEGEINDSDIEFEIRKLIGDK